MPASRKVKSFVGISISIILMLWLGVMIEWDKVLEHIKDMHFVYFIPALLIFALHYALRTLRWRFLLPGGIPAPFMARLDAIMIGNFATYVLPLRAGEFIRPFLLSLQTRHAFPRAFASVVLERFFDLAMVLISFATMIPLLPGLPDMAYRGALSLLVLAAAIVVFIVAASIVPTQLVALAAFFLRPLPQRIGSGMGAFIAEFVDAAKVLHSARRLIIITVLSVLVWASCYLLYNIFFMLFGIDAMGWSGMVTAVIIALAVAAPSAPGFIGVYEVACVAAFKLLGFDGNLAVAFALVTHLLHYVLFVLYAAIFLTRSDITFTQLRARSVEMMGRSAPVPE